ncbi:hypothetical protein [Sphingobacterium sp. UBA5670]|uniref:hypothetical protein n=1 Tax=Sphingobacterium sp. UBA5670 TaxID=1947502 RepID=UPI0025EA442B|nr:hypothetical protein [Sphingobacterium sp. UBA5670]
MANNKKTGLGMEFPPDLFHVTIYFSYYKRNQHSAAEFFNYYQAMDWKNRKGKLISNWKVLAWQWIFNKCT